MSIAIVTDTACNVTPEMAEEYGIYLLPLEIIFGETSYRDGYDISTEEFYDKLERTDEIPTTSQPQVAEAVALYTKLVEEYDQVLSIHLDSRLSGTFQTLRAVANDIDQKKITVFDTKLVTIPAAYLVLEAKRMADQGEHLEEIIERLEEMREHTQAIAYLNDLEYLSSGGRIKAVAGNIINWIKIKPIVQVKHDELKFLGTARSEKRVLSKFQKKVQAYLEELDYPFRMDVGYGNNLELAKSVKKTFEEEYPSHDMKLISIDSIIGTHAGPEVIGIAITPDYSRIDDEENSFESQGF